MKWCTTSTNLAMEWFESDNDKKVYIPENHHYFVVLCSFDDSCAFTKLKKIKHHNVYAVAHIALLL